MPSARIQSLEPTRINIATGHSIVTQFKDSGSLDNREYLAIIEDNFCSFSMKTYVVTPHLNRLDKTDQMRGNNIWFLMRNKKNYHQILPLNCHSI